MQKLSNAQLGRPTPEQFARMEKLQVAVVLDNVRSAGNVGAFFRTADAFGIERVILCGISAVPPSNEIHKTALGAENTVAWSHFTSTVEAVEALRTEGYIIVAVEQVVDSAELGSFVPTKDKKYALVFGNEVDGVSQDVVDAADTVLEIPQVGTKHSLNVAVSGGVVLWEFFRALR